MQKFSETEATSKRLVQATCVFIDILTDDITIHCLRLRDFRRNGERITIVMVYVY